MQNIGTAEQAIDFAVKALHDGIELKQFLIDWQHGDVSDWPEYYDGLMVTTFMGYTPKQILDMRAALEACEAAYDGEQSQHDEAHQQARAVLADLKP